MRPGALTPPTADCILCGKAITKAQGICHVPSDDGFDYHADCAQEQADYESSIGANSEQQTYL